MTVKKKRHGTGDSSGGRVHPVLPLISIVLCIAAGCATNPYPIDSRPSHRESDVPADKGPGTIEYARRYADRTFEEYRQKLSAEVQRQQLLSNSLISLGAATLGIATFGGGRDGIVATALAGGTGYALGTWDTSRQRPHIYVEGMKALSCAKSAIRPLTFSKDGLEDLKGLRNKQQASIGKVASTVAGVSSYLAAVQTDSREKDTELVGTAEQVLADVEPVLSRATEAYVKSQSLTAAVEGAGGSLEVTVDRIRGEVTGALEGTRADLASLPKLISSLSDYAQPFAPGVDLAALLSGRLTPAETDPIERMSMSEVLGTLERSRGDDDGESRDPKKQDQADSPLDWRFLLATEIGTLRGAVAELGTYTSQLIGWVDQVKAQQVAATLDGCGIEAKALAGSLSLSRSVVTLAPKKAQRVNVTIKGGTLPYSHALENEPAPGINVSTRGDTVSVFATDQTMPGESYRVEVRDATGATVTLTIRVRKEEKTNGTSGNSPGAGNGETAGPNNRQISLMPYGLSGEDEVRLLATNHAKRTRVQRSLCTPDSPPTYDPADRRDGEFGPRTRFRIREFLLANEEQERAMKDPPELIGADIELLTRENAEQCRTNVMNFYEKSLTKMEICQVRVKLGLAAEPPVLDHIVRMAIFSLEDAADQNARDFRQLNEALFAQIGNLEPGVEVCERA